MPLIHKRPLIPGCPEWTLGAAVEREVRELTRKRGTCFATEGSGSGSAAREGRV